MREFKFGVKVAVQIFLLNLLLIKMSEMTVDLIGRENIAYTAFIWSTILEPNFILEPNIALESLLQSNGMLNFCNTSLP